MDKKRAKVKISENVKMFTAMRDGTSLVTKKPSLGRSKSLIERMWPIIYELGPPNGGHTRHFGLGLAFAEEGILGQRKGKRWPTIN